VKKFSTLFLFWVTLLALFVSITSIFAQVRLPAQVFYFLFIPVSAYLVATLVRHLSTGTAPLSHETGWMRLLVYYCFIVATILVVAGWLSIQTVPQLVSSLIFTPLAIYFLLLVWPRRGHAIHLAQIPTSSGTQHTVKAKPVPQEKIDIDRRDFLKIIGASGISVFIYSLLSKRNQIPFFSGGTPASPALTSLKDASGNKIDPAERSPTHGYYISEIDDSEIAYFGFVNKDGKWFIMRQGEDDTYRYAKGENNLSSNWGKRATLTYSHFNDAF